MDKISVTNMNLIEIQNSGNSFGENQNIWEDSRKLKNGRTDLIRAIGEIVETQVNTKRNQTETVMMQELLTDLELGKEEDGGENQEEDDLENIISTTSIDQRNED